MSKTRVVDIAILLYPNAQIASIHGLTDLFGIANRVYQRMRAEKSSASDIEIRVSHWDRSSKGDFNLAFDSHKSKAPKNFYLVIVPPSLADPITPDAAARFTPWICEQHRRGSIVASVCSGAFLLAETGLLADRTATTHWTYANAFANRFPQIDVDADRLIVDDGDLITAGGLMAWTDLGLKIVDRILGPVVMLETARFMLLDPSTREQSYYSQFSPELQHGDSNILKVQRWLQTRFSNELNVADMAKQARLEPRTFLRRFQKATGLNPTAYCQQLRIGKAREKLQFSNDNVDSIAWSVGYEDPGAFRKIFRKITGLTPGEYRNRFSLKPQ